MKDKIKFFGFEVEQKVYTFGKGSPTIFINAGTHGSEVNAIVTAFELIKYLRRTKIKGTINVLPVSNPYLTNNLLRYPEFVGKTNFVDFKNPNRVFPGNENGTFIDRIAAFVNGVANESDFVIDLHCSRYCLPHVVCEKENFRFAQWAGMPLLEITTLETGELVKGRKGVILELGPAGIVLNNNLFNNSLAFVLSLLGKLGVIVYKSKKCTYICRGEDMKKVRSKSGAIVKYVKNVGEFVDKGDVFAYSYDYGGNKENLAASERILIRKRQNVSFIFPGEQIIEYIPASKVRTMEQGLYTKCD